MGSAHVYKRILSNLLDNAFRFSNLVDLKAISNKKMAILTLTDHGKGVANDKLAQLAKAGFSENTNSKSRHYGLRL